MRRTEHSPAAGGGDDFVPLEEAARRLGHADTRWREAAARFPVRWPRGYFELAASPDGHAIRRMGVPAEGELAADPGDLPDPVGERGRAEHPYVVRKHADRAIVLVTARCHFYCRFCFRRSFPDGDHRDPTRRQLDEALDRLLADPSLREVILSGGDPLVLPDERLRELLARIRQAPQVEVVRVHTRAPVHHPVRVTPSLVEVLTDHGPTWLATHFNHPVELTDASTEALARLADGGVPLLNQTVLLAGVNDAGALAELCRGLYRRRVRPYYLHHPDRAPGNAAFRVTIPRGLELYRELRDRVPGPALPAYVIDLPDGSGKVPVETLRSLGARRWCRQGGGSEFEDIPGE